MTMASIFNVFGRSPIRPLQAHMSKILTCVETLVPFINAVINEDWTAAETYQKRIAHVENEADKIKRELRVHLPNSLFLPVARSDLLDTLRIQDKIADKARDIAGLMLGRKLLLPVNIQHDFISFTECNISAVKQTNDVICELGDLMESGFTGNEVSTIEKMILEIDQIESNSDSMQIKIRRGLYDCEKTISPIDIMFLYKIVELTGTLADGAKHVGDSLQLILAR